MVSNLSVVGTVVIEVCLFTSVIVCVCDKCHHY
jgi:hypothetical protein